MKQVRHRAAALRGVRPDGGGLVVRRARSQVYRSYIPENLPRETPMKSSTWFAQAIMAILLLAARRHPLAIVEMERRLAAAERDLVMLRYADAASAAAQPGGRIAGLMPARLARPPSARRSRPPRVLAGQLRRGCRPRGQAARCQRGVPRSAAGRPDRGRRWSGGWTRFVGTIPKSSATIRRTPKPPSTTVHRPAAPGDRRTQQPVSRLTATPH